jgi:YfiH family protein
MSLPVFTAPRLSALPGVAHGFFGRRGGVSGGLYASLNCGLGSKDDPAAVAQNRARIAAALAVAPDHLLTAYQVHSARAARVSGPWGASPRPEVDGLATTTPNVAVAALAADCAPILLADAEARVVCAVHAGWKGALAGVLDAAITDMIAAGAHAPRIVAAIGPCIGQTSYEVGPEFQAQFVAASGAFAAFFAPGAGDRLLFDLKGFCAARLAGAGVTAVDILPHDTCADPENFFSNRRAHKAGEPDFGRNLSAIVLF